MKKKWFGWMTICLALILVGCAGEKEHTERETKAPRPDYANVENTLQFSQWGGVYGEEFDLTISCSEGSQVYYTLDGSDPADSEHGILYDGAISVKSRKQEANVVSAVDPDLFCTNFVDRKNVCYMKAPSDSQVDKCTVVRAVEKFADGTYSSAIAQTYFIGTMEEHIQGLQESCKAAGQDLAVVSISMNYEDLFDYETGIYVKGAVYDASYATWDKQGEARKLLANYSSRGKEWERVAHMELYEVNGDGASCMLSQNCGVRIQGNYSRSDLQKSFRLIARDKYGDNRFTYAIWGEDCKDMEGDIISSFKSMVLRAGGNCAFTAKYNDTYWQTLVGASDLDVSTKQSRPAVVYLNGEYWGLYVLEEDYSTEYFDDHYGIANDDVVIYKGDAETYESGYSLDEGKIPEGETEDYYLKELRAALQMYPTLSVEEWYDEFCQLVDPDSFLDYMALEVWINNKWDWPGKNWSIWKSTGEKTGTKNAEDASDKANAQENPYNDGRWRLLVYDVEFGGVSGSGDAGTNTMKEDNYRPNGLLDGGTNNIVVRTFVLLMSNPGFRERFCARLEGLSAEGGAFEKTHALEVLNQYEEVYGPLFDQFYNRYPDSGSKDNALWGGYASSKCIRDFLEKRADKIPSIVKWTKEH